MNGGYQIRDQQLPHFLTFQIVAWVDLFTRECYREIVVDSFNYCIEEKGLRVHAWVIMSNHVHCILQSRTGRLSDTIRDLKAHTSRQFKKVVDSNEESRREWMIRQFTYEANQRDKKTIYQIWTRDNHPVEMEGERLEQRTEYIHLNPVRAGCVEHADDYLYSSARDYEGKKGLVEVEPLYVDG